MFLLQEIGAVLLTLAGAIVATIAVGWISWSAFKLVRHPEWGPCLLFVGLMVVICTRHSSSSFLQTAAIFSGLAAAICWLEGGAWRARHQKRGPTVLASPPS